MNDESRIDPDCQGCPFDPNGCFDGVFWQFLNSSNTLYAEWLAFMATMSNNAIIETLQNAGLQENIFNYSFAAMWARNLIATGLNSIVTYMPPYSINVPGLETQFADVGVYRGTQHEYLQARLKELDEFHNQGSGPLVYQVLRAAATRKNNGGCDEVLLAPLAFVETKFLRRNKLTGGYAVSAQKLFEDLEKMRKILAIAPNNRPILPMVLWLVDRGDNGAEVPVDGLASQNSLREFIEGVWMSADGLVPGTFNNPYQWLSKAMRKPLQEPHFTIHHGGKVQKTWIHRLAFLRFPVTGPSHYSVFAFVPCKVVCD